MGKKCKLFFDHEDTFLWNQGRGRWPLPQIPTVKYNPMVNIIKLHQAI